MDQEYCIFHKPNKTPVEAREFYEKFLEKTKPEKIVKEKGDYYYWKELDCRGYVFPPTPAEYGEIFRNAVIGSANCSNAVFEGKMVFEEATFEDDVDFSKAKFQDVSFSKAVFKGDADFRWALFGGETDFSEASFEGSADFSMASFSGSAIFESAKFYGLATFNLCDFRSKTLFWGSVFCDYVLFDQIAYNAIYGLDSSAYLFPDSEYSALTIQRRVYELFGDMDESDETFIKSMRARRRSYLLYAYGRYIITYNGFKRIALVLWKKMHGKYGKIRHSEGEQDDCITMLQESDTDIFDGGNKGSLLNEFLLYVKHLFIDYTESHIDIDEDEEIEHSFWRKMKTFITRKLRFISASLAALAELLLVDLTSEYGTNWRRPILLWLLTVLFIFPFFYWLVNGVSNVSSLGDYFYFSIITATTVGFGDIHPIGVGRILSGIEAVFGTFMWAIFLTVMARKYMR